MMQTSDNINKPSKLDAAIAAVTKGVKRLGKGERNAHAGYNFAGIDDFLEMTGKLCGEAGLNVIMDEEDFEVIEEFFATKNGKVAGLRMKFAIYLRCEGEQIGPFRRSILVPANMGSQAFGAGQSYALKQFLRATFQIPTGEKGEDIDAHDTGTMARSVQSKPADAPFPQGPARNKTDLQKQVRELWKGVREADSSDALEGLISNHQALIDQLQEVLPHWWSGGVGQEGQAYDGLGTDIERARQGFAGDA